MKSISNIGCFNNKNREILSTVSAMLIFIKEIECHIEMEGKCYTPVVCTPGSL